jgi:alkylated DNA repair dioxygenase AlkB
MASSIASTADSGSMQKKPLLVWKSAGEAIAEGDTTLVFPFLPSDIAESAFNSLKSEVAWSVMRHHGGEVPRLVAVEGAVNEDGSFPIYRHPSDESPPLLQFTPTVSVIRSHVERVVGHPVNHVLIQFYRSGTDYISEHSDKTIDVDRSSKIVNVSLGAQRTMVLRQKKDRDIAADPLLSCDSPPTAKVIRDAQRVNLPNNSIFIMGLQTNEKWTHEIRQDNRMDSLKSEEERAFNCERISLTFRNIKTFLSADQKSIYGQGATGKTAAEARPVISGNPEETERMVKAFSMENRQSQFAWDEVYGQGFDVLHFTIPPIATPAPA